MTIHEQQARQNLSNLLARYNALSTTDREHMTEASVVRQFIDLLLRDVLGWPIEDPARYKYEHHTAAGRPDITLIPERGGTIFVEAKRFGVIQELKEARYTIAGTITPGQLALPGMSVDRTPEEQQAINYAFQNGGTWAILTNFEKLRLFNARRDWLVLSFERPHALLEDFDLLWQMAYPNILNGSLDNLSKLRHTEDVDTRYLAFINDWRERLARDIVAHPERNPWAFLPDGTIDLPALRAAVQRFLDRLVIIRFAEDHLVVRYGVLRDLYDVGRTNDYFAPGLMMTEFFRRFDQRHNSALFAYSDADRAVFSDDVLLELIAKLYEARYRSMSADIIGNTYEQYLGKALVLDNGSICTRDNLETRKKQGSYYTPQVIVRHLVDNSLGRYLYGTANGLPDGEPVEGETRKTSRDIIDLRVLDSACGSGSFLIYAYQVLANFYESERARLQTEYEARNLELARQGLSPVERRAALADYLAELERIQDYPRLILETHLYGVDLDPQAAEIATVNLMMRAWERRQNDDKRLPLILNQNIKVGNSLIGLRYDAPELEPHRARLAELRALRADLLTTAHGPEHNRIIEQLAAITAELEQTLNAAFEPYFSDLSRIRPFHWGMEFPEVFYNEDGSLKENPGFTIIIGNPPWEIVKPDLREYYAQYDPDIESKYTRAQVERRIAELNAADPRIAAGWEAQARLIEESAAYYRICPDYTRQGRGDTATYKLFLERMYSLLQTHGWLGYLVPSGIYSDLGTKELRGLLLENGRIEYLISFSNAPGYFADIHRSFKFSLVIVQRDTTANGFWALFRFDPRITPKPSEFTEYVNNSNNFIYIKRETIGQFSPYSLSILEFHQKQDYAIIEQIYRHLPFLGERDTSSWNVKLAREFDMTNDGHLFHQDKMGWPVYEGRMIGLFDHRYAYWVSGRGRSAIWHYSDEPERFSDDYPWRAQFYIAPEEVVQRQKQLYGRLTWRIGVGLVTASTNKRTVIAAMLPMECGVGHSIGTITIEGDFQVTPLLFVLSAVNSIVLDYVMRFRVKLNVGLYMLAELPVPRLTPGNFYFDAIVPRAARLTCTRAEFAELWREALGEAWDTTKGAISPTERQRLRDEIDALVAHLYGLSRADFDHILGTFPLVFPDTPEGHARREALLAVYDEFAAITKTW